MGKQEGGRPRAGMHLEADRGRHNHFILNCAAVGFSHPVEGVYWEHLLGFP